MITLAIGLWQLGSASYWRDEAATLDATRRSLPELLAMLGHIDVVHGLSYLLLWPLVHCLGTDEFVLRLPGVLAVTAAALGVSAIARRWHSRRAALLAGLVFAVLPQVSRYGQEIRSYALVIAIATLASYLLMRSLTNESRRWLAGYAVTTTILGLTNLFALLLLAGHTVTVFRYRKIARRWLIAVGFGVLPVIPIAILAWQQQQQLAWISTPDVKAAVKLTGWLAGSLLAFVLIAALAILGARTNRRLTWLILPWLVLPPVALLAISQVKPVYVDRYLVFCLPAVALAAGVGLASLPRPTRFAALFLIALLGLPTQQAIRQPGGHGDNIRAIANLLASQARPGDGVLFYCGRCRYHDLPREFESAYPAGFANLTDLARSQSPTQANNLVGTDVPNAMLTRQLSSRHRVWVITLDSSLPPVLSKAHLHCGPVHKAGSISLLLCGSASKDNGSLRGAS